MGRGEESPDQNVGRESKRKERKGKEPTRRGKEGAKSHKKERERRHRQDRRRDEGERPLGREKGPRNGHQATRRTARCWLDGHVDAGAGTARGGGC